MPCLGTSWAGRRVSSTPSSPIDPERTDTSPMIAFSAVVLPAPLRPSMHRTSPSATDSDRSRRMCTLPYQVLMALTWSMLYVRMNKKKDETAPLDAGTTGFPPPCGEGLGVGGIPTSDVLNSPHPVPPPQGGEGTLWPAPRLISTVTCFLA